MSFLVFNNYLKHPEPYKHFISILPSKDRHHSQFKASLSLKAFVGKAQHFVSCAPITLKSNTSQDQKKYLELYFAVVVPFLPVCIFSFIVTWDKNVLLCECQTVGRTLAAICDVSLLIVLNREKDFSSIVKLQ